MASVTSWQKMSLHERLTACAIDIMGHPQFALVGGLLVMGQRKLMPEVRTAATDGVNIYKHGCSANTQDDIGCGYPKLRAVVEQQTKLSCLVRILDRGNVSQYVFNIIVVIVITGY